MPALRRGAGEAQMGVMHRRHFLGIAATLPLVGCASWGNDSVRVRRQAYAGWNDAIRIENREAWVAIVPSVGRVMQFGLTDRPGVFWENPKLLGAAMPEDPWGKAAGSFGGDKTWPAPQSAWNWPPPDVFDRSAVEARIEGDGVLLVSPPSLRFGIVTERRIRLIPGRAQMSIETLYRKVTGDPVEVGIWVITQMKDPDRVYFPASKDPRFEGGWSRQWKVPPELVQVEQGLISMRREPQGSYKIGNDARAILWVGRREVLKVELEAGRTGTPADGGCSVELYTNGGEADYVELETLAPISRLTVGDVLRARNFYQLAPRTHHQADAEARLWF